MKGDRCSSHRRGDSGFGADLDLHVRRRNCDAAVERSPAFEALDEVAALRLRDTLETEAQADRVEHREIAPYRIAAVDRPLDLDVHRPRCDLLFLADDLHQIDAASGYPRQEVFRGRDGLPGTAVLHGTVDYEMMVAGIAQHPSERIGRACVHHVAADFTLCHFRLASC